jgi:hypothetical protein
MCRRECRTTWLDRYHACPAPAFSFTVYPSARFLLAALEQKYLTDKHILGKKDEIDVIDDNDVDFSPSGSSGVKFHIHDPPRVIGSTGTAAAVAVNSTASAVDARTTEQVRQCVCECLLLRAVSVVCVTGAWFPCNYRSFGHRCWVATNKYV